MNIPNWISSAYVTIGSPPFLRLEGKEFTLRRRCAASLRFPFNMDYNTTFEKHKDIVFNFVKMPKMKLYVVFLHNGIC